MASLTETVASRTAAGKPIRPSVQPHDTLTDIVNIGKGVFDDVSGAISKGKAKKQRQAAQQRAQRSAEIQEIKFTQAQEDRADKQIGDNFRDDFHRQAREVQRTVTAVDQGSLPSAAKDIAVEKFVTSLEAKYPDRIAEFSDEAKAFGIDHLIFKGIRDDENERQNQISAEQEAQKASFKLASEQGLIPQGASFEEGVVVGQEFQQTQTELKNLQAQRKLVLENRKLNNEDRAHFTKLNEQKTKKAALRSADQLSGVVVRGFTSQIGSVSTAEEFAALQKDAPNLLAQLENVRSQNHELADFDPDAVALIDKVYDRQKAFIEEALTGDLSFAQQQARKLSVMQTEFGIEASETMPMLTMLNQLPKGVTDLIFQNGALAIDSEFADGLADEIRGIKSPKAEVAMKTMNIVNEVQNGQRDLVDYDVKDARQAVKTFKASHDKALDDIINNNENFDTASSDYATAQTQFIKAADRLSGTQNQIKHQAAAVDTLLRDGTVSVLTSMIGNPATKTQGELLMKATRASAFKLLDTIQSNTTDNPVFTSRATDVWKTQFNETTGQFEGVFDEEGARRRLSNLPELKESNDQNIRVSRERGPSSKLQQKVSSLNQTLNFLNDTREFDKSDNPSLSPLEYRKAYATRDLGALLPSSEPVNQSATDVLNQASQTPQAILKGKALTSNFRTAGEEFHSAIDTAAQSEGLPPALLHAVADQESGHLQGTDRSSVTNSKSAKGIFQITPIAAKDLGVDWESLDDPQANAAAGAEYLAHQMENFNGDIKDALMAYNAGPTRVRSWIRRGRPIIEGKSWQDEAFPYVENILKRLEQTPSELSDEGDDVNDPTE